VNAGHGLHYRNTQAIAAIPELTLLNIGHAIVAQALFVGLPEAVKTMRELMIKARKN
jgi:pyridoxine 5-phosphate synthase